MTADLDMFLRGHWTTAKAMHRRVTFRMIFLRWSEDPRAR